MERTECVLPTFGILTEQQIEFINNSSNTVPCKNGEVIFMQNRPVSHLIYIKSGLLKLSKENEENREIIIDILSSSHFLGLASVFYDNIYPYSATAIQKGQLIYTPISVVHQLIAENGKYALSLLNILSTRVIYMMDRMTALTKKQVPGRIAELLLLLSKNIFKSESFDLPLSRIEIADYVQTTKETVSRVLTEFKHDRIIELNEKKIVLKSFDLLEILNKIG